MSALRYAVLWHSEIDEPHYDLMFETSSGSPLATWRSPAWPVNTSTPVVRLRDHRSAFLDFQGSLSQDRGAVTQIVSGTCEIKIDDPDHWTISWPDGSVARELRLKHIQREFWQAESVEVI